MHKPIIVTIEHHSAKDDVKRRLRENFGGIRAQIAPYVSSVDEQWTNNGVQVRIVALAQTVTSTIEVDERNVRIEVALPGLLGVFGRFIATRIQNESKLLLDKK